jgi:galactokinase
VIGENERVFAAVEHLRSGDIAAFGRLMAASHESSRVNFENSTPELDLLVALAQLQPGVHGARLTGGGFGGAIVAAVDSAAATRVEEKIISTYRQRTGVETRATRCHIGDGAVPGA